MKSWTIGDESDSLVTRGLFVSVTEHGTIVEVGADCVALTRHVREELIGNSVSALFGAESVAPLLDAVQRAVSGTSDRLLVKLRQKGGRLRRVVVVCVAHVVRGESTRVGLFLRPFGTRAVDGQTITMMIAQHAAIPLTLYEIVQTLEAQYPGARVVIEGHTADGTHRVRVKMRALRGGAAGTLFWSNGLKSPDGQTIGRFAVYTASAGFPEIAPTRVTLDFYSTLAKLSLWTNHYDNSIRWHREHDELTLLPNSGKFVTLLGKMTARDRAVSLLYIDLDNFEFLNETSGHSTADQVLKRAAERICGGCPPAGVCGRVAGDEFGIVLPGRSAEEALETAGQLLALLRKPVEVDGDVVFVTASIGIATGVDADLLMHQALCAASEAKSIGGDIARCFDPMNESGSHRAIALLRDIHFALERGQLDVYYQPRVDTYTSELVGAEALLRWHHPDWGVISSGEFIDLLEREGFMTRVGEWVVDRVCSDIAQWAQESLPLVPVSVNFSPHQLTRPGVVTYLLDTLNKYGVAATWLEVELTERLSLHRDKSIASTLAALAEHGIRALCDDYGTGHTSVVHLLRFPFHALKVDLSLTRELTESAAVLKVVRSLTNLVHELGLRVVVEGVETPEQMALLQTMACDELQGYLFSRPIPEHLFRGLLREQPFLQTSAERFG